MIRELSISMRIARMSGAHGIDAVAAAVMPLLMACTRNHHTGTFADFSPMVLKVVPQAVSAGLIMEIPQRWLAVSSKVTEDRFSGKNGMQPNRMTT
ncbi:hypothetical protein D3C71_1299260 [compost metagenome]